MSDRQGLAQALGEERQEAAKISASEFHRLERTGAYLDEISAELRVRPSSLVRWCQNNGFPVPPLRRIQAPSIQSPTAAARPTHVCPECGKECATPRALGSHRHYKHAAAGTGPKGSPVTHLEAVAAHLTARATALEADLAAVRKEAEAVQRAIAAYRGATAEAVRP